MPKTLTSTGQKPDWNDTTYRFKIGNTNIEK